MTVKIELPFENVLVYLAFLLICIAYLIPLVKHSLPVNWDAGFYYYHISNKTNPLKEVSLEPLYFYIIQPLANFFGVIPAMKLMQFLMIAMLSLSTYYFFSQHYSKLIAISIMIGVAFLPATSRMWADQYRSMLALVFLPLFLNSFMKKGNKHIILAAVFLTLMSFSHRLIFMFTSFSIMIYVLINIICRDWSIFKKVIPIFLITGILSSPFIINSLLPTAKLQSGVLIKWEERVFNFNALLNYGIIAFYFGGISIIMMFAKRNYTKLDLLLCAFWCFAFLLFTGVFGTPFLVYDRYIIILSIISAFFAAPYMRYAYDSIKENSNYKYFYYFVVVSFAVLILLPGFRAINKLEPYVIEEEIEFLQWINNNLPSNSTLLVSSRQHYWSSAISGMNVVPLEWYELLGIKQPSDEVLLLRVNPIQELQIVNTIKQKYNVSEFYLYYNSQLDPIIPQDILNQQVFIQKLNNWNQIRNSNNFLYLYKF